MHYIVCGAGEVGTAIAKHLSENGDDVTLIDHNEDALNRVSEEIDVRVLKGFASHPEVLKESGIQNANVIIAVTASDEINMLACQMAGSLFDVECKIARVRNKQYLNPVWNNVYKKGGIDIDHIIFPESEVASNIIAKLSICPNLKEVKFHNLDIEYASVKVESEFINKTVEELESILSSKNINISILAISNTNSIEISCDSYRLSYRDRVHFIYHCQDKSKIDLFFNISDANNFNLCIGGGGNVGSCIATTIEQKSIATKASIIEISNNAARALCNVLEQTAIINGDMLQESILLEADVANSDAFLAVSDNDSTNILASLMAKKMKCKNVVSLVNNSNYYNLVKSLEIDLIVDPKIITVSSIFKCLNKSKNLHTSNYIVSGCNYVEIFEIEIDQMSSAIGKSVRFFEKNQINIAAIFRKSKILFPSYGITLEQGDKVILCCSSKSIKRAEDLFLRKGSYF